VPADPDREQRWREPLSPGESMRLLGSVPMGRVAFSARALPAIRPALHLVDGNRVIIRADGAAPITSAARSGTVVAYEADALDPATRLGWSVVVVGAAHRVTDAAEAASYRRALRPWETGTDDQVVAISADVITGFRLVGGGVLGDGQRPGVGTKDPRPQ
jgi:Pyridoxamine 5'-phosphate oxidase